MSDATKQDTLFEVTGKKVTLWTNATGKSQYDDDVSDGYGCVIEHEDSDGWEETQGEIEYESHHTAPVAKYKAIINGIEHVSKIYSGVGVIHVYTDAEVVAEQINASSDTNESHLQELKKEAHRLLSKFDEWHINWQNKGQSAKLQEADDLAEDAASGGKP